MYVLNTLPSPSLLTKCVYTNSRKLNISLSKQTKRGTDYLTLVTTNKVCLSKD